jgi:hypothetical protein
VNQNNIPNARCFVCARSVQQVNSNTKIQRECEIPRITRVSFIELLSRAKSLCVHG